MTKGKNSVLGHVEERHGVVLDAGGANISGLG